MEDGSEALLVKASNSLEADLLETKLNAYGIPVHRKYKNYGDYLNVYMGATPFEVELYVPSDLLEKATDVIAVQEDTSGAAQEMSGETEVPEGDASADQEPLPDAGGDTEDIGGDKDAIGDGNADMSQRIRRRGAWLLLIFVSPAIIFLVYLLCRLLIAASGG